MKPHQKKEYRHIREIVIWLHDYTCYVCLEPKKKLDTHHIDGDNTSNSVTNLIPVCPECHRLVHATNYKPSISAEFIHSLIKSRAKDMELKLS